MKRYFWIVAGLLVLFSNIAWADTSSPVQKFIDMEPRIVGGYEADPSDWPWFVGVMSKSEPNNYNAQSCGGSLIQPTWVLTAAHCFYDGAGTQVKFASDVDVLVGAHDLSTGEGQRIAAKTLIIHPSYDDVASNNDMALIELVSAAPGETVAMYAGSSDLSGITAMAIGWGNTSATTSAYPYIRNQVELPIVTNTACSGSYGSSITDSMLCAGFAEGGKDSCQGDSGGPLVIPDGTGWAQVGVTSWGNGCAQPGFYGVYARVSELKSFVDSNIGNSGTQKLYYPHVATAGSWETEVCVINTGDQTVTGSFKTYGDSGTLINAESGITLPPKARKQITVGSEFTNPDNIGYVVFESVSSALTGYTKFMVEGDFRGAVPAVRYVNREDILVSHIASSDQWWTGLSLVNTTSASKTMTVTFNTGVSKTVTLGAGAHSAFSIKSLFGDVAQPTIASAVISNAEGIIGLELFATADQMAGILLTDQTSSTINYPHVASDNGWVTGIAAYNPGTTTASLTISPYSASGTALATQSLSLSGKDKYLGTAKGLSFPLGTAWFKITSDKMITGFELFGKSNQDQIGGYAGVNIDEKAGVFPKIEQSGGWTGIAFVNTSATTANISLTAYSDSGSSIATRSLSISGHSKIVESADNLFTGSISGASYVMYTSDQEVVGFQLNGDQTNTAMDALPSLK